MRIFCHSIPPSTSSSNIFSFLFMWHKVIMFCSLLHRNCPPTQSSYIFRRSTCIVHSVRVFHTLQPIPALRACRRRDNTGLRPRSMLSEPANMCLHTNFIDLHNFVVLSPPGVGTKKRSHPFNIVPVFLVSSSFPFIFLIFHSLCCVLQQYVHCSVVRVVRSVFVIHIHILIYIYIHCSRVSVLSNAAIRWLVHVYLDRA